MDIGILQTLGINLFLTGLLLYIAKWFISYDMRWWLRVQRSKTALATMEKWVYLKIRLPKEVYKTPAAMETVLLTLNQPLGHKPMPIFPPIEFTPFYKPKGNKKEFSFRLFTYYSNVMDGKKIIPMWKYINQVRENFWFKYISGSLRSWTSLEIVSDAGDIYFLVVTKANNKEIFTQYAYSQFPGIEITEEKKDPLDKFYYTDNKTGDTQLYVGEYKTAEDKDHLPIKTYVDYGLDKEMIKDEFKVDPLVTLLEAMSQAKKGEMYWFQILIRPTIYTKNNDPSPHPYDWKKATEDEIDKILDAVEVDGKKVFRKQIMSLTTAERVRLEILQKNLEKPAFDCQIRMFYWVDKKINPNGLDVPRGVMTVVNALKPFNKPGYNDFTFVTMTVDTDTPFLDPTGLFSELKRKARWKLSKLRAAFYQEAVVVEFSWAMFKKIWDRFRETGNWDSVQGLIGEIKEYWKQPGEYLHRGSHNDFVLNLEELATLWHFPGKVFVNAESKVPAIKAEPPSNLPI